MKAIRESVLDEVKGIGEAKKIKLLSHFHSVKGISKASVEEISHVAGVSLAVAEQIIKVTNFN
jgi:excinuclease ABC subunit C